MPLFENIRLEDNIENIIQGCIHQRPQYQEMLYKKFYAPMVKLCYRYATDMDHAAALYNEAMLKVFAKIKQYGFKGSFEGWLKRVVVNTCIDDCRKKSKFAERNIDEIPADSFAVEPDVYGHLQAAEIIQLIQKLPKNTGLVFNLYVLEGYKHLEIAELLGITEGTSKWHLNEARRLLKIALATLEQQQHYHLKKSNATN